jgi:trehalose/maltose transport system substrate-binding protein
MGKAGIMRKSGIAYICFVCVGLPIAVPALLGYALAHQGGDLLGVDDITPVFAAEKTTAGQFEIEDFPRSLRKDLSGTSIRVALPENAPDAPWDDALLAKFHELTGINVQVFRPGNDTTAVLPKYLRDFESGTPKVDVYAIDIVWPGILSDYAEDLRPAFGELPGVSPRLVENDTVNGKLVAVPYFTEISVLYYRRDLLEKYHFGEPPRTWGELEQQAATISAGERAEEKKQFWGYLWQGAASEALTCNALEWQISQGGGGLLEPDRTVDLEPARAAMAWERARRWVGTISPPEVTRQLEDDSLQIWKRGDAAFMRNWPYAYLESMQADSNVRDRVGVTVMPGGDGQQGRHADMLGGFQLMVSKASKNKEAAIELVRFLTSPEIQRVNAIARGYAPTRPDIYEDPAVLRANPFFGALRGILVEGGVTRPSTAAGARYDAVSTAYFSAVHQTLTGEKNANRAAAQLEKDLRRTFAK